MLRFALVGLVAFSVASLAGAQTLEERILPIVKAHKGKVKIAVKHLETGETYLLDENDVVPTASLIKLPIMVETFRQAKEGKVKLDQVITLKKEDQVPGSGVLTDNFTPGATFTLLDAVRLMITVSDNTATNLVLDAIGIPSTNVYMKSLGFPETRLNAKVYRGSTTNIDPERLKLYGLGSTTAKETCGLLEKLHKKEIISPEACDQMLEILKLNHDNELFVRYLPTGTVVAKKTGAVSASRTDAGIVYIKGKAAYIYVVLTSENEDKSWVIDNKSQLTMANIGKAVHEHFVAKSEK